METGKRLRKYSEISLGVVLVMAFVLIQPTMQQADAVGIEGLPSFDECDTNFNRAEDPLSMNTVRSGNIVKTIHAEKIYFQCFLDQGSLEVGVDVTTYIEVYENIVTRQVLSTSALSVTCIKEPSAGESGGATVIDCESKPVSTNPVPVGSNCEEETIITHPQEMNTVSKGKISKTIETQKEVFNCRLSETTEKKVDVILFTEIYEDLSTQTVIEIQFHSMRCVVLVSDDIGIDPEGTEPDGTVESCKFSTIEN